MGHDKKENIQL